MNVDNMIQYHNTEETITVTDTKILLGNCI